MIPRAKRNESKRRGAQAPRLHLGPGGKSCFTSRGHACRSRGIRSPRMKLLKKRLNQPNIRKEAMVAFCIHTVAENAAITIFPRSTGGMLVDARIVRGTRRCYIRPMPMRRRPRTKGRAMFRGDCVSMSVRKEGGII